MVAREIDTIDVRTLIEHEPRPLIFKAFRDLAPAAAFVLVSDLDPRTLHCHFNAEYDESFEWKYLEGGAEVWKVQIGMARLK